ncbi:MULTISPECIES: iron-containing alcohol dehydrogenase [unclassified Salinivibrio]|uniref:iron-containing alcohol dehydrogenase n=1 Tax=unclassified Salinivibrio TaxID=2636825 RepID=UPI00128CD2B2|nr:MULTISPECIES: iron-containing alcohol dehydrogenase [unclassified Salinivibrio]MPS31026.1 iron-containing alcohol dehydrogenase [Salinivibrio sp. VYel7]MPX92427.1 iron-containing alcohol dehydrogenase [Salinivibrio sp. VYel9]MPX97663.1 iron-containing alcohol dehydrogenase [Salinivibrio sp. VYel6]MPX98659.1 iron-containing alcohol dehydrogenase [Salinivibrio sp. VYel4]MPY01640.1 iron-containing alcohol dehydrogenase [Salinivibrio sp. VYel5]
MNNFEFYNPTRIVFGEGKIAELDRLIPADAKVLILFGGQSARKTGTLDEVEQALGQRQFGLFGGIEPNPRYETLMKAVEKVGAEGYDYLLAVGGGSVIDGTKFVAAAAKYDGDAWDILTSMGGKVEAALPFGSVLTLPATGSEMNKGSVVTRESMQAKLPFMSELVFPQFSVLDPVKTYTLPIRQVGNGAVDAFVHVVEQYLTYPANAPVQDRFAEGLLQTLVELGPQALETPEDYNVRASLMWTATLALNGLIGVGVPQDWSTHMLGHELTAQHGLDHAQTLAVVLPAMLNEKFEQKQAKLAQFAERVWHIEQGSDAEKAKLAIEKTRDFFERMNVKTRMSDYDLDETAIEPLIESLTQHGMTQLGEHGDVTPDVCRRVLQAAL